ncbi:5-hydroxytryptamine receptor 1-like [Musca vetustissima]|uniref:5-hydroxytryptamine receptor 1-like n=1 Tax=Musca vetustissima TaxID=27455 RepID=UPI002AB74688|nr:5-hydroxytryptamine receptor 1-like [Musca vetustissima]
MCELSSSASATSYRSSSTTKNAQSSASSSSCSSSSSSPSLVNDNFKFQRYHRRKSCPWKRISQKLKHFMLSLLRTLFYLLFLLSLSDCWFQVGSASLILAEAETNGQSNFGNRTSTVLQLPIQALIFEVAAAAPESNGHNRDSEGLGHNSSSLHATGAAASTQTNDGMSVSASSSSTSQHSTNNKNHHRNQHSISNMFTTSDNSPVSTYSTITSTLSTLAVAATTTNDTQWPPLLSSPTQSSASLSFSSSAAAIAVEFDSDSTSLPSSSSLPTTLVGFTTPAFHTVLVSIILLFVILGTIVGNVLVCIAVCMVRKLRRPCNYLLVSLALSDLCVAVLVMPMALLYEILEKWSFGPVLCDIWVSFDVLCCTASILNLCAISVDRYLAITKPLEYGVKRTPRRMMLCVALVWLAAACISLPPLLILGNEHEDEHGNPMCSVCQNFAYQIYATLGSFYIPLAVMLFVYYQIFRAARRIVLEEKRAQTHLQHALNGTGSPPGHTDLEAHGHHQQQHRHSSYGNTSLNYSTCGGLSTSGHHSGHGGHGGGGGSGSSGLLGSPHQKKLRFQLAKEKKASTTLGIIMSAFTICWLPFFILALIRPFVESETTHVPQSLSSLFLWLGYANSLLNPIIYATLNRDFRKPFQEILYFRCSSLNTMMRENYYQDQYGEPPSQRVMLGDERHGARESFL